MANDKLRGIVYCITNQVNGMRYVGQTRQPLKRRLKDHFAPSKSSKTFIGRAIKKYGKENFSVEVIAVVEVDELNSLEQDYIDKLSTLSPEGYNLTTGGERFDHTEETKRKISKAGKGRPSWIKGRKMIEEHKNKISVANTGKKKTEQMIENMRDARPNKKKIVDQNGKVYKSIGEASREISIHRSCIDKVLKGLRNTAGGYSFSYLGGNNVQR